MIHIAPISQKESAGALNPTRGAQLTALPRPSSWWRAEHWPFDRRASPFPAQCCT